MHPSFILLSFLTIGSAHDSAFKVLSKFYNQCSDKTVLLKCLKIQSLKVMDRALHAKNINIIEGVSLVGDRQSRDLVEPLNGTTVEKLSSEEVDMKLEDTTARFLDSHRIAVNISKLVEEGRKRGGGKKGGWAALMVALAIKGSFLAMAYQGIAVMSGTAIIVGKMALILSAILGLKKLVSSGHERTTFEIVKVPKYSESHTHSTSYDDDDHHYRRSFDVFGRRIA